MALPRVAFAQTRGAESTPSSCAKSRSPSSCPLGRPNEVPCHTALGTLGPNSSPGVTAADPLPPLGRPGAPILHVRICSRGGPGLHCQGPSPAPPPELIKAATAATEWGRLHRMPGTGHSRIDRSEPLATTSRTRCATQPAPAVAAGRFSNPRGSLPPSRCPPITSTSFWWHARCMQS